MSSYCKKKRASNRKIKTQYFKLRNTNFHHAIALIKFTFWFTSHLALQISRTKTWGQERVVRSVAESNSRFFCNLQTSQVFYISGNARCRKNQLMIITLYCQWTNGLLLVKHACKIEFSSSQFQLVWIRQQMSWNKVLKELYYSVGIDLANPASLGRCVCQGF